MATSQLDLLRQGLETLQRLSFQNGEQPSDSDIKIVSTAFQIFLQFGESYQGVLKQASAFYQTHGFENFLQDPNSFGYLQEAYETIYRLQNETQESKEEVKKEDEKAQPIVTEELALEGNSQANLAALLQAYQDHQDQLPQLNKTGQSLTLAQQIRLAQMAVARRNQAQELLEKDPALAQALLKSITEADTKAVDPSPTVRLVAATAIAAIPDLELSQNERAITQELATQILIINPNLEPSIASVVAVTQLGFDKGQISNPLFTAAHELSSSHQSIYDQNLPDPEKLFLSTKGESIQLNEEFGHDPNHQEIPHGSVDSESDLADKEPTTSPTSSVGTVKVDLTYDDDKLIKAYQSLTTTLSPAHATHRQLQAFEDFRQEIHNQQSRLANDPRIIKTFTLFTNPIGLSDVAIIRAYYLQQATPEQAVQISSVLNPKIASEVGVLESVAPSLAAGTASINYGLDETKLAQIHAARLNELKVQSDTDKKPIDSYLNDPLLQKITQLKSAVKAVKSSGPMREIYERSPLNRLEKFVIGSPLNKVLAKAPLPVANFVRVMVNPVGFIKNRVQLQIGRQVSNKLYLVFRSKVSNPFARQVARAALTGGTQKAAALISKKIMLKLAATKAGQWAAKAAVSIAAKAALAESIIGIPLAVLWTAIDVVSTAIAISKWGLNKMSVAISGEEISGKEILAVATGAFILNRAAPTVAVAGGLAALNALLAAIFNPVKIATKSAAVTISVSASIVIFIYLTALTMAPILSTIVHLESGEWNFTSTTGGGSVGVIGPAINSCANTSGTFVFQRDSAHAGTFCQNCSTSGTCNIGYSGCGSASMTMILRSFGASADVVSVWHRQHEIGGYYYYGYTPPYPVCGTDNNNSLDILRSSGLQVVETSLSEASTYLQNCGLILATGRALCGSGANRGLKCGHLLVIRGISGNQLITMDPDQSSGDGYVHTIGVTYAPIRYWAVTR